VIALVRRYPLTVFFVLAYAIAWAFVPFGSFGAFGPLVAALIVVPISGGRAGLRELGARLIRWRVGWLWWVVAIGVPLGVNALSAALTGALGTVQPSTTVTAALLAFAVRMINPTDGPLGEEPAWRGYAQPVLQGRGRTPLASATILAVLITGWHLPLFFLEEGGLRIGVLVPGLVGTMAVSYWYAWLFNRSGGSSLLTLVAHNVEGAIASEPVSSMIVWSGSALMIIVLDLRRWRSPAPRAATSPAEGPASQRSQLVHQEVEPDA
jgi:uncharacterized protein